MREFLAVIFSFFTIPLMNRKNIPIGFAICVCAILMALTGGLGWAAFREVLADTFLNIRKIQQYIIIIEVCILGSLLGKYKIIDKVIHYLTMIVSSNRIILMSIPALVGLLSVPGGAIISVPFVDRIGDEVHLSNVQRAVINLVYRHIAMHVMPYTSGFLLVASLAPQISLYKLAGLNGIFVLFYIIIGYFLYVARVPKTKNVSTKNVSTKPILPNLIHLLTYTSPVYLAVLLNLFLQVPFYFGLLVNLLVVFLLHPVRTFFRDIIHGFNYKILFALIGVYLIQGVIGEMESLTGFLTLIFSNPDTIILGIIATSFFFGMTTGFQPTALGVLLPILTTLSLSDNQLLFYCHFTFAWSFVGYFFSPLHLCQLFTCEYLKVSTSQLYKEYWKFFLCLAAVLNMNYFWMGIWFN